MAINVSVQYNGGLLPNIIQLTQCYYHRGTRLNAMKRFVFAAYFFPPDWGMLRRSRRVLFFSLNNKNNNVYYCTRTGSSIVSTKFLSFVFWNFEPRIIIKSSVFGLHEIRAYEYRSLILLDIITS